VTLGMLPCGCGCASRVPSAALPPSGGRGAHGAWSARLPGPARPGAMRGGSSWARAALAAQLIRSLELSRTRGTRLFN